MDRTWAENRRGWFCSLTPDNFTGISHTPEFINITVITDIAENGVIRVIINITDFTDITDITATVL
jgi:hypothetical protein